MLKKLLVLFFLSFSVLNYAKADGIFHDLQGQTLQKSNLQGKWLIVNYWAAWCGFCVKEIPELNEFVKAHKNILFYGVNYDHLPAEPLKAAVEKMNIQFPVLVGDPAVDWQLGEIEVLPTTFIINPKGELMKVIVGPTSAGNLEEILKSFGADMTS